jgi:NADH:ubiquinone oxidoreductase subunit 4 (subunit M)
VLGGALTTALLACAVGTVDRAGHDAADLAAVAADRRRLRQRADPDFQLIESANWIVGLNIGYLVGVDGISLLFLPATACFSAAQ